MLTRSLLLLKLRLLWFCVEGVSHYLPVSLKTIYSEIQKHPPHPPSPVPLRQCFCLKFSVFNLWLSSCIYSKLTWLLFLSLLPFSWEREWWEFLKFGHHSSNRELGSKDLGLVLSSLLKRCATLGESHT